MASHIDVVGSPLAAKREGQQSASELRFDWIMVVASIWWVGGLFIDGWAHSNIPQLETFFTPWHAIFYSGYLAVALTLVVRIMSNLRQSAIANSTDNAAPSFMKHIKENLRSTAWLRAIPAGYELSLLALVIFLISGIGDMTWHIVFGIERGTEALLSPTHLGLALGVGLALSGPLRAAWHRAGNSSSWQQLGPAMLSLTFTFSLLTFFIAYAYPFINLMPINPSTNSPTIGITDILLQTGLTMSFVLLALRRWRLPWGTFTFMFGLNGALMAVFHPAAWIVSFPTAFLGGLAADLVYRALQPSLLQPARVRLFAFLVPTILFFLYFINLAITGPIFFHRAIVWAVPFWTGAPVIAGIVGFLLSYVMVGPEGPIA